MKRIARFLKATTIGGIFVLLPVIVACGIVVRVVNGAQEAAGKILAKFAGERAIAEEFPLLVTILLLLTLSFFLGVGMISGKGRKAGNWIERTILTRIPGSVETPEVCTFNPINRYSSTRRSCRG